MEVAFVLERMMMLGLREEIVALMEACFYAEPSPLTF